ncbi:MAG: hypothetical protein ACI3YH_04095 [Eubacteriales bacterium]
MTVPTPVSAVFAYIEGYFAPESKKKPLLSGRQKRLLSCQEVAKKMPAQDVNVDLNRQDHTANEYR